MRRCTRCKLERPLSEFGLSCGKPRYWCKRCMNEYGRERHTRERTALLAQSRLRRILRPEKHRESNWRRYPILNHFGTLFTWDDYLLMLNQQDSKCAIKDCRSILPRMGRGSNLDNDHATGIARGILCSACNRSIGHAQESSSRLKSLAEYLEEASKWKE